MTDTNDFFDPVGEDTNLFDSEDPILAGIDRVNKEREAEKNAEKPKDEQDKAATSKYTKEELLTIFDALVFEGEYRETHQGRGLKATFRSRTGKDAVEISRALDRFEGKSYMTISTYANILTLVYSIVDLNGVDFSSMTVEDRYKAITKQSDAINALLYGKLSEFDEKISLAIEEGRKNF